MAVSLSRPVRLWFACSLAFACGDGRDTAAHSTQDDDSTSLTLPPNIFPTDSSGGGGGEMIKLDLPGQDTDGAESGGRPVTMGCEKVDLLFVIDNSKSMLDEQTSLVASFPGFIAAIEQTLTAKDYHIMAVSSDRGDTGEDDCKFDDCACMPAPSCCKAVCADEIDRTCNGTDCGDFVFDECDFKYGSGRVYDQFGTSCDIADGRRYMLAEQPELEQTFACAATIGALGSGDEKPIQSALAALGSKQNQPGGCNEGFLRDDAILVLVIITDEEDDNLEGGGSYGDPADWYQSVVTAKLGVPSAAVVLGLVGDGNLLNGLCPLEWDPDLDGGEPAPRLQSFISMFADNGILGSVCSADYTPFFLEAVSVIDTACDLFEPVG